MTHNYTWERGCNGLCDSAETYEGELLDVNALMGVAGGIIW